VLIHGYTDSWRSFERVLPHLPESIHAFALTLRGHGDAEKLASGYGLEHFTMDIAQFMDAVAVEAAVIVGSSSGGYYAQRFAIDHPERALGLVLIGSPRNLRDSLAASRFAAVVSELSDPIDPAFVRDFVASTVFRPVPSAFLDGMVAESSKVPAHVWKSTLAGLREAVPPTDTGTIFAPTLIVWGDRDEFVSRGDQEGLLASIPGSWLVVYEGGGHFLIGEEPERIAADVVVLAERATAGS
jgi:pimeloyl-ACP methyl ester carboxylesterase